jgi:hypothetical protein
MTIMPFLAQGETVAPRPPVLHHDFSKCTTIPGVAPGFIEKCTAKMRNAPSFF